MTPTAVVEGYQTVELERLVSGPNHRQHTDEKTLKELAASIAQKGILEPLLVRPIRVHGRHDLLEVVAGRRRLGAAKVAKIKTVPVIVRELSDAEALEISIIENLQREDVHPIDEAEGYRQLLATAKYDPPALAAKVGKSERYIYQRLKLTELVPEACKKFLDDRLSLGHAILLARLQPNDQRECVRWLFSGYYGDEDVPQGRSLATLKKHIDLELHLSLSSAPWKQDDATLVPAAGSCTACPKRTGNMPSLFPDGRRDVCTDRACFATKLDAFLVRRQQELGTTVLKVSEAYGRQGRRGDVLTEPAWKEVASKKACASVRPALLIDGERRGQTIFVCADSKCQKHHEFSGGRQRTAAEAAGAKRSKEQHAQRVETRKRAIAAVLERVKAPLSTDELKFVAGAFFAEIWSENRKHVAEIIGFDRIRAGQHGGWNYEETWKRGMTKAGPLDVARSLVLMALARDIGVSMYAGEKAERLDVAAKRYRVSVKTIARTVAAERRTRKAKAKQRKTPEAKAKKEARA